MLLGVLTTAIGSVTIVTMSNREAKISSEDVLSVPAAAKELGKAKMTLYRWIRKGQLLVIRLGGKPWVPLSEVHRLKQRAKRDGG